MQTESPRHAASEQPPTIDPVDLHVGARVRLRRRLAGQSQGALGQALGLSFQQIQKYETGANRISASKLHAIARALDVPVAFFFDGLPETASPLNRNTVDDGDPALTDLITHYREAAPINRSTLARLARILASRTGQRERA